MAHAEILGWRRPIALSVLLACSILLVSGEAMLQFFGPEVCPSLLETGRPCMGCGGTRAFGCMARGRVREALALNPLGAFGGAAVWLTAAGALLCSIIRTARPLLNLALLLIALTPAALVFNGIAWFQKAH